MIVKDIFITVRRIVTQRAILVRIACADSQVYYYNHHWDLFEQMKG
jgi:hypothetical protein